MAEHISTLMEQLTTTESKLVEHYVAPHDLFMTETGKLRVDGQCLSLQPSAIQQLSRLISCPVEFYQKVPGDLRAHITNRLIKAQQWNGSSTFPEQFRVITLEESLVGISDAKLLNVSGTAVMGAIFDAIPDDMETDVTTLEVRRFQLNHESVAIDLTTPKATVQPRVDDIVAAGLSVSHSYTGLWATQISTYLHRLACKNGMLVPVCRNDRRLRIRRLDGSQFCQEKMLENIRHISQIAWSELDVKLQAFAGLCNNRVDPEAVLADLVKRMHLNRKVSQALRDALHEDELGFDDTQMGVINALSRVATHYPELNPIWRHRLMEASGVLSQQQVHRCPTCLSIIRGRRLPNF